MSEAFICDAIRTPIGAFGDRYRLSEPMIWLPSH